eukprot:PhF_6_TR22361/c0_g1_i1/m.31693
MSSCSPWCLHCIVLSLWLRQRIANSLRLFRMQCSLHLPSWLSWASCQVHFSPCFDCWDMQTCCSYSWVSHVLFSARYCFICLSAGSVMLNLAHVFRMTR